MGLFSSKAPPPAVPSDRVIPFRFSDDFVHLRSMCLDVSLRFDNVLDPEKLRGALEDLLDRDGWRKLGARLRLNKNKLEYHVPAEFSTERPAVLFSTDKQDMAIGDHPVLSKLPKSQNYGETPTMFESPSRFRPYMRAPGAPEYLADWLKADIPQLAVHVLAFDDASIVTVTFMHTLTDAMGIFGFLRAWTAVLRGDEDKVPAFVGFDASDDPLATLHEGVPASRFLFAHMLLTGWRFFLFVLYFMFELLWWPRDELRTICVPGAFVAGLRETALAELAEEQRESQGAGGNGNPFVSESDVLLSWWTRTMLRALNPSPTQTICLINVFDPRGVLSDMGRLPSSPPEIALLANAMFPLYSFIPASEFLSGSVPLSRIAAQVRHAIDTLRTPEQVQAQAANMWQSARHVGRGPLYGEPGMMLVAGTNWHRGKLFDLDFSGASTTTTDKVKPVYVSTTSTEATGFSLRNAQLVAGKDAAGNWWITSCLRTGAWPKVRELLAEM